MLGTTTEERNAAAAILESLARCDRIRVRQTDDAEFCANDMIAITPTRGGWVHDPATINRLRAMTYDGRWPND